MACLVIFLSIKNRTKEKRAEEKLSGLEKYTFVYSLKKGYEIWEDKNKDILYIPQRALGNFSPSLVLHKGKHSSISIEQTALRSSFSNPIGNQGQANRLPKLLSD